MLEESGKARLSEMTRVVELYKCGTQGEAWAGLYEAMNVDGRGSWWPEERESAQCTI